MQKPKYSKRRKKNDTLIVCFLCISLTQLRETDSLSRPVVLVRAKDAEQLMGLVNKNEEAKVRIEIMVEQPQSVSTETHAHTCVRLSSH